ncbi:MAG: hypothetical protein RL538_48 [Candidatus Parcubacteria bacterium]|jgi:hypothetical protein
MNTNLTLPLQKALLIVLTAALVFLGFAPYARADRGGIPNYHANYRAFLNPGHQYKYTSGYYSTTELQEIINQLLIYLAQLQDLQDEEDDNTYDSDVEVKTLAATDIDGDEATLRGEVTDFNSSSYATVWFQHGYSQRSLHSSNSVTIDDDEDGLFTLPLDNLIEDRSYYYRAVARDDDGDVDYGELRHFITDGSNYDDTDGTDNEPDVDTDSANDIDDDSVTLRGSVDMNDFEDGLVFFIYGESENQIDDIENDFDTYNDIDEDGVNLQKVTVDSGLDDDDYYEEGISGLDEDTDYFFRLCVEYEDEDTDEVLACGTTEDFTTDEF